MSALPALLPPADVAEAVEMLRDVGPGDYWRAVEAIDDRCPAGTVLLVLETRVVDGRLHTLVLAGHPSEREGTTRRFLADDFFARFERAFDAEAVRDAEVGAIHAELDSLRREIAAGPPSVALLPGPRPEPTLGALVAARDRAEDVRAAARALATSASDASEWVGTRSRRVGELAAALAPFYRERALAALASVAHVRAYADRIESGLKTLGLFTGESVEVEEVVSGEPAPVGAPLTVFQHRLYLDEELAVHLLDGGADFSDLRTLGDALRADPALRDRLLPDQRSVVLLRVRRHDKDYGFDSGNAFVDALAAEEANRPNRRQFLLVRDGKRVLTIFADVAVDEARSLFPSSADADRPFRGVDGTEMSLEDVRYTDARRAHDDYALVYRRLLVLLWGLDSRGLLGPLRAPGDDRSFLDPAFQAERFVFVEDRDRGLPPNMPPWRDWVRAQNALVQSGSRVLVVWRDAINERTTPHLGRRTDRRWWTAWEPTSDVSVEVARVRSGAVGVELRVRKYVFRRGYRENGVREMAVFVPLDPSTTYDPETNRLAWLCLDAARPEDVRYYAASRINRESYLRFLFAFRALLDRLDAEAEAEGPVRDGLAAELADARVEVDPEVAREAVATALRLWRAAHRGAAPPGRDEPSHARVLAELRATVFTVLERDDPAAVAEAFAVARGLAPLGLALTGRNRLALYVETPVPDREDRIFPHPWVTRIELDRLPSGPAEVSRRTVPAPRPVGSERVVREWTPLAGLPPPPFGLAFDRVRAVADDVDAASDRLGPFLARPASFASWLDSLEATYRRVNESARLVVRFDVRVAVAVVADLRCPYRSALARPVDEDPDALVVGRYLVVSVRADAFELALRWAETPAERERVLRACSRTYRHADAARERLLASTGRPTLGAVDLADHAVDDLGYRVDRVERSMPVGSDWREALRRLGAPHSWRDGRRVHETTPFDAVVRHLAPGAVPLLDRTFEGGTDGQDS